ncbi:hypothetical protein C3F22_00405 [Acinetobacter sp. ACNIH1]|nr:hypothetical protein C3F22_00405 [Acinetobacter sp. ACNIH1]
MDICKITYQTFRRKNVTGLCKMKRNFKQSSVKIYKESISALKDLKSIAAHITSLGKIMNKVEDTPLQTLIKSHD